MNKVFLYTYWIMWGVWSGDKPKLIERAWLTSILPPFYSGAGIQIRIGKRSLRIGVCVPRMPVTVDEYSYVDTEENLAALYGYELDDKNKEIRRWGSSTEGRPQVSSTAESSGASSQG